MALSISFDHAQKRVDDDRISVYAGGAGMHIDGGNDVWVDPITKTLMIKPSCLKPSWYTSNAGDYAKLGMSAFGLSSTDWEDRYGQHSEGPWISRKSTAANGTAITSASYAKNRGFFIAWFSYGAGDVFLQLRCGWNSTATIAGGIGLEVYSDGTVLVYKAGALVGNGKISGNQTARANSNSVMELMLLPFRHRELLVYGNGDGFSVLFDDIAEDAAAPEITPATKWWFEIVDGGTQVQTAPLVFNTAGGTAYSIKTSFLEPPAVAESQELYNNDSWLTSPAVYKIYGHPGYGSGTQTAVSSLVEWDTTAFTPDGTTDQVRLKTVLSTTDSGYTPFVYGALMGYSGTVATTSAAEEYNATAEVTSFSLSVPDSPDGVRAVFEVRDPLALEAHVSNLRWQCNRPIVAKIGSIALLDGIGDGPILTDDYNEAAQRCRIEVADRWDALAQYTFRESVPLDGVTLDRALKFLARRGGFESADCSISTTAFEIPFQPSGVSGEWGTLIEPGDSAADWFHRLMETYAGNWVYGIRPTSGGAQLYAQSPTDLGTTAAISLYRTSAAAVSAGFTGTATHRHVYHGLQIATLEPIANDISVTGLNPRTGRPLRTHKADYASMDPTTVPSSRPDNWLGFQRPYNLTAPEITTQAACDDVCQLIYDRFTEVQEVAEWTSTLLLDGSNVPYWRGANVRIVGSGTYRILSFEFDAEVEVSSTEYWRECRYTGLKVAPEP